VAFYAVGVPRLLLVALIIGQTKAQRAPLFTWTAPIDIGAPCSGDGGLSLPAFCGGRPEANVQLICTDDRPGLGSREQVLCNDRCTCPFGSTCVWDNAMTLCQKRCFAPGDCARGQFCHRFRDSEVSACLEAGFTNWRSPSDWIPKEQKYWSPASRWLEPYRSETPSPAQRVKEAADEERRQRFRAR
jgi:hypothetical protein